MSSSASGIQSSIPLHWGNILRIALPIMWVGLVQNIVSLTDRYFLGNYSSSNALNEIALGAHGLASVWYFIFMVGAFGLSTGLQVVVARRLGENDLNKVGFSSMQGLQLAVAIGLLQLGVFYVLTPILIPSFVESPAVAQAALAYLLARGIELPLGMLYEGLHGFYSGIGRTRSFLLASLVQVLSNVYFNWAFIHGKHGFPEMGIAGAGWASALAQGLGLLTLAGHLLLYRYHRSYRFSGGLGLHGPTVRLILQVAAPVMLQHTLSLGTYFFFFDILEARGALVLAASNLLQGVYIFFMIPVWGFGSAANTLVSNHLGGKSEANARRALKRVLLLSLSASGVAMVVLSLFSRELLGLMVDNPSMVDLAQTALPPVLVGLLLYSLGGPMMQSVMATGASTIALAIEIITLLIYLGFLYFIVSKTGSLVQAWWCEAVYMLSMAGLCFAYLKSGRWRRLSLDA